MGLSKYDHGYHFGMICEKLLTCVKDVVEGAKKVTGAVGEERLISSGVHAAPLLLHRWTHSLNS